MISIDPNDRSYVTQINTISCKPEHQDELLSKMTAQAAEVMAKQPGCISLSLHKSLDGTQVVNYVQWAGKELLDAAPEFQRRFGEYRHLILDARPRLFIVVYQHGRESAS